MEDTVASELHQVSSLPLEEHQEAGQEMATSTELGDEGSQCTYFQAQDGAGQSSEEGMKCAESVPTAHSDASSTVDHRCSKEGEEHEDLSLKKTGEGVVLPENPYNERKVLPGDKEGDSQVIMPGCSPDLSLKPREETACEKTPGSTEPEAHSLQTGDDLAEKKLEIYLVEETVQLDGNAKEHVEVSECGGCETCPTAEATSTSEDHQPKLESMATQQHGEGSQVEFSSQSNNKETLEATKDNSQQAEVDTGTEHTGADAPVITVESFLTTHPDNTAELSKSDMTEAPHCQKEHDVGWHLAECGAKAGVIELPEVTEHGSIIEAPQEPVKVAKCPEDINSSEDHDSAENAEPQCKESCSSHGQEAQHIRGAEEEKGILEI